MKFLFIILFIILVDLYAFLGLLWSLKSNRNKRIVWFSFGFSWLVFLGMLLMVFVTFKSGMTQSTPLVNYLMGLSFVFFIVKSIIVTLFFIEDLSRFIRFIIKSIQVNRISSSSIPSRRKFIRITSLSIAALPFVSLIYGMIKGKYDFKVHPFQLYSKRFPKLNKPLKIVHISDLHLGSFDSMPGVEKGINMIKNLKPDLLLFTGDMVNNIHQEAIPYIELFKSIETTYGKYSILGNHDYGDYMRWNNESEKIENLQKLKEVHDEMGFDLLLNESRKLMLNDEQCIQLIGVENWGLPPFPQKGDLNRAMQEVDENIFSILLSHDPDHWGEQVIKKKEAIDLTLSGHTHGSQMGIEVPGYIKWSPVAYRYKRWAGIYKENEKYLYVNRGFGFLGYPGRVGIWPEITYFEISSSEIGGDVDV